MPNRGGLIMAVQPLAPTLSACAPIPAMRAKKNSPVPPFIDFAVLPISKMSSPLHPVGRKSDVLIAKYFSI